MDSKHARIDWQQSKPNLHHLGIGKKPKVSKSQQEASGEKASMWTFFQYLYKEALYHKTPHKKEKGNAMVHFGAQTQGEGGSCPPYPSTPPPPPAALKGRPGCGPSAHPQIPPSSMGRGLGGFTNLRVSHASVVLELCRILRTVLAIKLQDP